jgi:hypothetical protein
MSVTHTHVYGEFVGAHHVEAAILSMLWKWLPSYQYEVSREAGLDPKHMLPIRSWRVSSNMERYPEDQLPCVILVNNGMPEPPRKHNTEDGSSVYLAHWAIELGIQVAAKGQKVRAVPRALTLARMYSLAIRLAMVQQRDDDGVMGMTDPLTERPNALLDLEADRTTCIAVTTFSVETDKWAEWGEGPIEPFYPPEGDNPSADRPVWPVVESWDLDVDKVPLDEPFPTTEG